MPLTLGAAGGSQVTFNYDSLFTQSLAAYKKTGKLVDQISNSNAIFHELIKGKMYQSEEGGTHFKVPLMYQLAQADWYSGYDELAATPTDGVTEAQYTWAQAAVPITWNGKEIKQNKQKLISLSETKIMQAELGFQEFFANAILWGGKPAGGNLHSIPTSAVNGAQGINPLPLLVKYDPTTSHEIGNLNQSTYSWWRNRTKTSAATTYDGLLLEMHNLINTCGRGPGGRPDLALADQTTYELLCHAYWLKYRKTMESDVKYPFVNVIFDGMRIVMDEKIPDVANDAVPVDGVLSKGTIYLLNTKFMSVKYESSSDFEMLKDDNGKAFQKPTNQDARLGHIAWMGQTCVNQRRKQGVMGNIARTLAA